MDLQAALGPWRGFWSSHSESARHSMWLDLKQGADRLQGEGADEIGRFTVRVDHRESPEGATWLKSYVGGHDIEYRGRWLAHSAGFVGRWFSEGRCGGTVALWPGILDAPLPDLIPQLPKDVVRFRCLCGKELEIEAELIGEEIECPWCATTVIAPDDGEPASAGVADPPPKPPAEWPRCPTCAGPGLEPLCSVCGVPTVPADRWELHPASTLQDVVSPETADWIFRKSSWLVRRMKLQEFSGRRLILPTDECFPGTWTPSPRALEDLLQRLQRHAGLDPVRVRIQVRPDDATESSTESGGSRRSGTAGCFRAPVRDGGEYLVEVRDKLWEDRLMLVATLAHELGHLYIHERLKIGKVLPADHEFLTDLVTIALGFGYFTGEAAFRFRVSGNGGDGWSISTLGYLGQSDLSFALALWSSLLGWDPDPLLPHLGTNSKGYFRQAWRFFEAHADIVTRLKIDGRPARA